MTHYDRRSLVRNDKVRCFSYQLKQRVIARSGAVRCTKILRHCRLRRDAAIRSLLIQAEIPIRAFPHSRSPSSRLRWFFGVQVEFCRIQVNIIFDAAREKNVGCPRSVRFAVEPSGKSGVYAELCQQKSGMDSRFFALLPYMCYAKLLLQRR